MTVADQILDEASRPRGPRYPDAEANAIGRKGQRALVQIHGHLRQELDQIRDAVRDVLDGGSAAAARSLINNLTMRQNYWSLGAFCAAYCRVLAIHHTIEDEHMFASLRSADEGLAPVLTRLGEEHEVIAGVLSELDATLVAVVDGRADLEELRRVVDVLGEALTSHLAYEEEELLGPIGRYAIPI